MRTLPNMGYLTEAYSPPSYEGLCRTNRTTGWRKRICGDLEINLEATPRFFNPGQRKQPVIVSRRGLG